MLLVVLLFLATAVVGTQGQQLGGDDLVIHIVPHSHVEHGHLETVEAYRTDSVEHILTQVTTQLALDPSRRFVWAELAYFRRWYDKQPLATREKVQRLVHDRQLEFVGGGEVEHDEAVTAFSAVLDSVTEAHHWFHVHFGFRPRVAWQLDAAGHSDVTPAMYAKMGYDAFVISRIHHQVLQQFKGSQHLEFLWEGADLGGGATNSAIFTHVLLDGYTPPDGFDFEGPGVRQVVTPNRRARLLVKVLQENARYYKTQHLLVPIGGDFRFHAAEKQFTNWDKLLRFVNEKISGVKIQYSTASEYFNAVRSTSSLTALKFPVYHGDFFPYATSPEQYWVGFYSSRPQLKAAIRELNSLVRTANVLYSLARARAAAIGESPYIHRIDNGHVEAEPDVARTMDMLHSDLARARQTNSLCTHHHAITGTAKPTVIDDFMESIQQAKAMSHQVIRGSVEVLLTKRQVEFHNTGPRVSPELDAKAFQYTLDSPTSSASNEHLQHPVVFHNTQLYERFEIVRIAVNAPWRITRHIQVMDADGRGVPSQVQNWLKSAAPQGGGETPEDFDTELFVYFPVRVPPLGMSTYFIYTTSARDRVQSGASKSAAATPVTRVHRIVDGAILPSSPGSGRTPGSNNFRGGGASSTQTDENGLRTMNELPASDNHEGPVLENSLFMCEFHATTGLLKAVTDKRTQRRTLLNQNIQSFTSASGSNAVLFHPDQRQADTESLGSSVTIAITSGPLVQEIQVVAQGFRQDVRLYSAPQQGAGAGGSQPSAPKMRGSARSNPDTSNTNNGESDDLLNVEGSIEIVLEVHPVQNKDIMLYFETSMHSNGKFFTDNALGQLVEREIRRDAPTAGNMYPAVSTIGLRDNEPTAVSRMGQTLVLVSNQPHGVSSPLSSIGSGTGTLQVMVHRNYARDDELGGMEDFTVNKMAFRLGIDTPAKMSRRYPALRHALLNRLLPLYARETPRTEQLYTRKNWLSRFHGNVAYLNPTLVASPASVKGLELISLQPRDAVSDQLILRVRNSLPVVPPDSGDAEVGGGLTSLDPNAFFTDDAVITAVQARTLAMSASLKEFESMKIGNGISGSSAQEFGSFGSPGGARTLSGAAPSGAALLTTLDLNTGASWDLGRQEIKSFYVNLFVLPDSHLRHRKKTTPAIENAAEHANPGASSLKDLAGADQASGQHPPRANAGQDHTRDGGSSGAAPPAAASLGSDDATPTQVTALQKKIELQKRKIVRYQKNIQNMMEEIKLLKEMEDDDNAAELESAVESLKKTELELSQAKTAQSNFESELVQQQKRLSTPSTTLDGQFVDRPQEYLEREKEATMHGAIAGAGGMLVVVIAMQWLLGRGKKQAYVPVQLTTSGNSATLPVKRL